MAGLITTVVAALIIVGVLAFVILSGDTRAEIEIDSDTLRLLPVGKAKILAFRSNRAVPLSSVRGVETVDNLRGLGIGFRTGGSSFPGIVYAGNFWSPKNGRAWLVVGRGRPVVVIHLDGRIKRFIFSATDPQATVAKLQRVTTR